MKHVKLMARNASGSESDKFEGDITDDDIKLLRRFQGLMERVTANGLVRRGVPALTNINWAAENGMTITCPPFQDEEMHALLHVLRPVVLQDESTSFAQISALLTKRFANKSLGRHLKYLRAVFTDGELSLFMQFHVGGVPILDDSTFNLWLNADQYHADEKKLEEWKKLEAALSVQSTRDLMMTQLQSKVKSLLLLSHIVDLVLD